MREKLIANFNWLAFEKVLKLVGSLIVSIMLARHLGPEGYGLLNYSIAFVAIFMTFSKLGMNQIIVRDLIRRPESKDAILGTVFLMKLFMSVIFFPTILIGSTYFHVGDSTVNLLVVIIAFGIFFNVIDTFDVFYQSELQSKYIVQARSFSFVTFSLLRVLLVMMDSPIIYFALAVTLEIFLASLIIFLTFIRKYGFRFDWKFDSSVFRSLIKDGWPLILTSALVMIHTRVDQVMIGQLLYNTDVGLYSTAIMVSEAWLILPGVLIQTLMPYFTKLRESNQIIYEQRLSQLYSLMFWFGVLFSLFVFFFTEEIVTLLFGSEYALSAYPLSIVVWTGIFISQAMARSIWMISENLQIYRLINNLIAVPINILLNLILIPKYGISGAATASLITVGLSTWIIPYLFKPLRSSNTQMITAVNPMYLIYRVKHD